MPTAFALRRRFVILAALVALALAAPAPALSRQVPTDGPRAGEPAGSERAAVLAAVQRFFDTMAARDTAGARAVLLADGQFFSMRDDDGRTVLRRSTFQDYLAGLANRREALLERMQDPDVRIHGGIATVWGPYQFDRDGTRSHCGIDAIDLVKIEGAWRIAGGVYTVEPEGCRDGAPGPPYDVVIRGGSVVDGTGAPRFRADVAIRGDRIVRIDRAGIPAADGVVELDATGLVVAPGFIDHHAHIQTTIHEYPLAENFIRQGITTILASLHSGAQPWPLDEYMASLKVAPNVGFFAGHSWVRTTVLGLENRPPTAAELEEMKQLVEVSMQQGALGLSTGLLYVPANYAKLDEVIELARVAARYGGIYVSHMRDEATGLLESISELTTVAREAGLPAQVQHHKAVGRTQWGWSEKSLGLIDEARVDGLDITLDLYPYTASSTGSSVLLPQWALAGGRDAFAARVADPETRARIERDMRRIFEYERGGADLANVQFRVLPADRRYDGRTLADLAADRGLPNTIETGIELVIELQLAGGFSAIYHSMSEEDVVRIMRHPLAMFCTDGDNVAYDVGYPHPRSYGAFPRVLGRYVRELKALTLEEAIRKMTSLSADQIGQRERGRIAEGMFADVTVFDPETVADRATYADPHQFPVGIRHVLVNGVPVVRGGALTGATPGRVIKGPARPVER